MAVTTADPRPRWPDLQSFDPTHARVSYDAPADELLIHFGGRSVPSFSDTLEAPGFAQVAVMVGMNPDETSTGEVVGVQVMPLLLEAVKEHPEWAALAWGAMAGDIGVELLREQLPSFLVQVADLFD